MACTPNRSDIRIAIICALPIESRAVEALFETTYETKTLLWNKADGDTNTYTIGRIGQHNVVLAYMPGIGKVNATATASGVRATFRNIELALLVGICGGSTYVPIGKGVDGSVKQPIYLGDVVISTEIQQSDFGRENANGFVIKGMEEGNLPRPSAGIAALLHKLQSSGLPRQMKQRSAVLIKTILDSLHLDMPDLTEDVLFQANYLHKHRFGTACNICLASELSVCEEAQKLTCIDLQCEEAFQQRYRSRETALGPEIFLGRISSSDAVKKNGMVRDQATIAQNIIAFEMEAAGVFSILPTLLVKGVCDYADSHKNKAWQAYAAITAATCAKVLLEEYHFTSTTPQAMSRYEEKEMCKDERTRYLESLYFAQLDQRLKHIAFPMSNTSSWIFESPEFKTWLDDAHATVHNRVFWIKGKPGSGKSTMMKHLYYTSSEYLPTYNKISYFFHARGSELERTPIGMLRALLYQLLSIRTALLENLIREFPRRNLPNDSRLHWSFEELQSFFQLICKEGYLDNTVLFIDALDECDFNEAGKIANFCEDLAITCAARNAPCFICLSTRHFPNIDMKKCVRLDLEKKEEHRKDIRTYIEAKLRVDDNQSFIDEIMWRSNHVFLWAVLVVQRLNLAQDDGADKYTLQKQLLSIPSELHAIFEKLLGPHQSTDPETRLALQIVLYAFEPIGLEEWYFVTRAVSKPQSLRSSSLNTPDVKLMHKFLTSASRGLLEVIHEPEFSSTWKVQFIHQSVRDYLLGDGTSRDSIFGGDDLCHEMIARAYVEAMLVIKAKLDKGKTLRGPILESYFGQDCLPKTILHHTALVSDSRIALELLDLLSKVLVVRFHKTNAQWYLSDQTSLLLYIIDKHFDYDYADPDPLPGDLSGLLDLILGDAEPKDKDVSLIDNAEYYEALQLAIERGWIGGIEVLIEKGADVTIHTRQGVTVLQAAMNDLDKHIYGYGNNPIGDSVRAFRTIVGKLKEKGHDFNDPGIQSALPLAFFFDEFSYYAHIDDDTVALILKLILPLLEAGASPTAIDPKLGAPLDIAVRRVFPCKVVRILLEYDADPHVQYSMNCTPMEHAVRTGNEEMIEILRTFRPRQKR